VSFVSVTQQFNTTTFMGRLMLNVLLSIPQFEREVTGERIRDKIAASKKKGMWMGGRPPIGYELKDRKLVVKQAEVVRHIFGRYAKFRSLTDRGTHSGRISHHTCAAYFEPTSGPAVRIDPDADTPGRRHPGVGWRGSTD